MARLATHSDQPSGSRTLIVDNGAHSLKAGFLIPSISASKDCHVIPNCISRSNEGGRGGSRIYVADQLDHCKDSGEMAFRRPMEKGFIVSWEGEQDIWKQTFFEQGARLYCDPRETNLLLSEAPNCPLALQLNTDQMVFEEFEFTSAYRCLGS